MEHLVTIDKPLIQTFLLLFGVDICNYKKCNYIGARPRIGNSYSISGFKVQIKFAPSLRTARLSHGMMARALNIFQTFAEENIKRT